MDRQVDRLPEDDASGSQCFTEAHQGLRSSHTHNPVPDKLLLPCENVLLEKLEAIVKELLASGDVQSCEDALRVLHEGSIVMPMQASLQEWHGLVATKLQELKAMTAAMSASRGLQEVCVKMTKFWAPPEECDEPTTQTQSAEELFDMLASATLLVNEDTVQGKSLDSALQEQLNAVALSTADGV